MNKNIKVYPVNNDVFIYNHIVSKGMFINETVFEVIKDFPDLKSLKSAEIDSVDMNYWDSIIYNLELLEFYDDFSEFKFKPAFQVNWVMTDYCNLFCSHCCHNAVPTGAGRIEVDTKVLTAIIEKLNPEAIVLTGGEPLVLNNFFDVMNILKTKFKGKVVLATNATLINEENIDSIIDVIDSIDISIDGMSEEETDSVRGKGTYKSVLNTLRLLRERNFKNISLSMVFNSENHDKYDDFRKRCHENGYEPVTRFLSLSGRAIDNYDPATEMYGILTGGFSLFDSHYECKACLNSISVNSSGNLYPCNLFLKDDFRIANVLEDDNLFEKMQRNTNNKWYKEFSKFISWEREECKDCELNIACWSCPAMAYNYIEKHGDFKINNACSEKHARVMKEMKNV